MKKIILFILIVLLEAHAETDSVLSAKALLAAGNRKEAMVMLERIKQKTKNKKEIEEIDKKKKLFFEQFLASDSYQAYQDAILFMHADRFAECLKVIEKIKPNDLDNKFVLLERAICNRYNHQELAAEKDLLIIQEFDPGNVSSGFELAELALSSKTPEAGFQWLGKLQPISSEDIERYAILNAKLLVQVNKSKEAIEILKKDTENHLDHALSHYEIALLYMQQPGAEWHARKYFTLFNNRCKKLSIEKLKEKKYELLCKNTAEQLEAIERKISN